MFKIKHERTADCVVAGYRVHKSGDDAIGSLLLGLYKDDGTLASVGVIGAFPMAKRRQLFTELQPLVTTFDEHPWNWAAHEAGRPHTTQETKARAGTPARTCRSCRCDPNGWSRSVTTTWKANGSATQRNSTAGAPTATHAHAPTPNSNSRSRSASAISSPASGQPDESAHRSHAARPLIDRPALSWRQPHWRPPTLLFTDLGDSITGTRLSDSAIGDSAPVECPVPHPLFRSSWATSRGLSWAGTRLPSRTP